MLETPHVVVAAAIAYKIPNPLIAIPLALLSHFVLEKVPHWNPHLNTETKKYGKPTKKSTLIVFTDAVLSIVLGGFIAWRVLPDTAHAATILAACFVATLPDLIEAPYYFLKQHSYFIEKTWIPFKKSLQEDALVIPGLLTQLLTLTAAFWWIFS